MKWSKRELEFINLHSELIEGYPKSSFELKQELVGFFGYGNSIDKILICLRYLHDGPMAFMVHDSGSGSNLRVELRDLDTHYMNSLIIPNNGSGQDPDSVSQLTVRNGIFCLLQDLLGIGNKIAKDISLNCKISKELYYMGKVDGKEGDFV